MADNGAAGVMLAEQQVPDAILCDVQMSEMDGYQVLHTLQQNSTTATNKTQLPITSRLSIKGAA